MIRPLALSSGLLLASLLSAAPALADVPPSCSDFGGQADCAADCAGKRCADGKSTCRKASCYNGPSDKQEPTKCVTCEAVIPDSTGSCTGGQDWGKPCGDGGTCSRVPEYCPGAAYVACTKGNVEDTPDPSGMTCDHPPTGGAGGTGGSGGEAGSGGAGDAGTGGTPQAGASQAGASQAGQAGAASTPAPASDDSGCAVAMRGVGGQGALAGLMALLGAAALLFDRRRR